MGCAPGPSTSAWPSLGSLQQFCSFWTERSQLDTVLQRCSPGQSRGEHHLAWPAGHALFNAPHDTIDHLCHLAGSQQTCCPSAPPGPSLKISSSAGQPLACTGTRGYSCPGEEKGAEGEGFVRRVQEDSPIAWLLSYSSIAWLNPILWLLGDV